VLTIGLSLPQAVFGGGKSGKQYFNEGVKHENAEQWDLAAQQYALALMKEPDNAEYRLRVLRAMQLASLMFMSRGDLLEAQGDYAGAYNAYAKALTYDASNEATRTKMARMIESQKPPDVNGERRLSSTRNGMMLPVSHQIQTPRPRPRGEVLQRVEFSSGSSLKLVIKTLARELNLNVVFDESVKDPSKIEVALNDVTPARALDIILTQNKLLFEQIDRRTIMIYADNPTNRQRTEKLLVKTFYLSSADLNETRSIVLASIGQHRQVNPSKQLNALVVRATASELAVAQAVIDSLDKNRAEVVLDVNIYDVLNTGSLQIGNAFFTGNSTTASDPTTGAFGLDRLGGFGYEKFRSGALFGLPASTLSLLQTKGNSKLLASTQIHALDGEQNQTVVGRSVPVKTGTSFPSGVTGTTNTTIDNITYRDVGLVIDVTPTITNDGYVQIKMKLESSSVEVAAEDAELTPSFNKRSLTTISRMQDGVTAVVACIKQANQGSNRTTVPVIGMVPILGRFFSSPLETNNRTDIVITITPRITRTANITQGDHLAHQSGTMQGGLLPTIEDVVYRAQAAEEQERREVAQEAPALPDASVNVPSAENLSATAPPSGPMPASPIHPVKGIKN
jgi:general secretion pathway protein D